MALDKNKIRKSFSASSTTYDQYASLQSRTACELILKKIEKKSWASLLDIGMGTGETFAGLSLKKNIKLHGCDLAFGMCQVTMKKFSTPPIFVTNADAEYLPYQDDKFDLIISNLSFQWLNDLTRAFTEIKRVLKKGGFFYLTIFGELTLKELKDSCLAISQNEKKIKESLHYFPKLDQVEQTLTSLKFKKIKSERTIKKEIYPSTTDLLKTLKYIGAKNASIHSKSGIIILPQELKKMCAYYEENFKEGQGIRATYEIYTLSGQK